MCLEKYIELVKKTGYCIKRTEIGNKIPNVTRLVTTAVLNKKVTNIANKLPDATS